MTQSNRPIDAEDNTPVQRLDTEQFATKFQEYYSQLWVLSAAILGDKHQAEDVVQEAAIVAMRQLDQFESGTNFVAWMSTIVRFQAFNRSRKRTRQRTQCIDPTTLDFQESKTSPDSLPLDSQASLPPDQSFFDDSVMYALENIGQVPRACLLLKTVHDLSYSDIANLLDIAEGTAMSHVHRSKAKMRQQLTQREPSSK